MAKWKVDNNAINSYIVQIEKMMKDSTEILERAIYPGAGMMADEISKAIDALPVVSPRARGTAEKPLRGITSEQKKGLKNGFGISSAIDDGNGYINVKLGFDGYNSVKTKKYPQGQPNALIARSVNSGTYFREKIPFIDKTVRKNKKRCEKEIEKELEKELKKLIKQ